MGCDGRNDDGAGGFPPHVGSDTCRTDGETGRRRRVVMAASYHGSVGDRVVDHVVVH